MASVKCGLILSHLNSLPGPTRGAEAGTGPPHVAGQRHLPKVKAEQLPEGGSEECFPGGGQGGRWPGGFPTKEELPGWGSAA